MYREMDPSELASRLGTDRAPVVLDVREPDEFAAWAIPGARNIPLGRLPAEVGTLAGLGEVVTVCGSGRRSAQAAEIVSAAGVTTANLVGGMEAWGRTYDEVTWTRGDLRVVQVRRRGKGCLSYMVGAGDSCIVVDPTADVDVYLRLADEHGWRVTRILETHLHADHLSGGRALRAATGATLHLNPVDPFAFEFEPLSDGERFELSGGGALVARAVHAPGHTRGSTVYLVDDRLLLSGDTLFVESVGRPDLADQAEAFAHDLYATLHDKLLTLGDDVLVLPGHYGDSVEVHPDRLVAATLGELRHSLVPLAYDEDTFVAWAAGHAAVRPPNYEEIVLANMGAAAPALDTLRPLETGPNRCAVSV
ncbi:MAG TPA: MBL fold metallo-hydrolase [Acidimicrobiales bacterium]|nr:MBL fold metallo-hydrolase [Acidimicrobiales bacterium]